MRRCAYQVAALVRGRPPVQAQVYDAAPVQVRPQEVQQPRHRAEYQHLCCRRTSRVGTLTDPLQSLDSPSAVPRQD